MSEGGDVVGMLLPRDGVLVSHEYSLATDKYSTANGHFFPLGSTAFTKDNAATRLVWKRILRSLLHQPLSSKAPFAVFLAAGLEDLAIGPLTPKELLG